MSTKKPVIVRQVWADNLEFEILQINKAIPYYPLVAMDTEFPGTIYESLPDIDMRYFSKIPPPFNYSLMEPLPFNYPLMKPNSKIPPPLNYPLMRSNVNALNIIQLGLTLSDSQGNMPSFGTKFSYVWEFNFRDFDIDRDFQNSRSIQLLQQQGIDFKKNKEKGFDSMDFARLLVFNSGLLCNRHSLAWITFHSAYDFGFLIKILTRQPLPCHLDRFMNLVVYYFGPNVYDMKYMIRYSYCSLHGGLESVAKLLHVERQAGKSHQAGSDSLLIMETFLKFMPLISKDDKEKFKRKIYG